VSKRQRTGRRFRSRAPAKIAALVARLRSRGVTEQRKPWFDAQCLGCVEGSTSPEVLAISSAKAVTRLRRYRGEGILGQRVIGGQSDKASSHAASREFIFCAV
jgi:hypothetical protein